MKSLKTLLTACCLGLFVVSLTACGGGPKEIKRVDEADRNMPPAAQGEKNTDDPNSGISTSFQ